MQFLHINEAAEWCREHRMQTGERFELLSDPRLTHASRLVHSPNGPPEDAAGVTEACLGALGRWDECLLWITDWDTWEDHEDWPAFYAARSARGERQSLAAKPGHLFAATEMDALRLFLGLVIQNSWDAHLLPVHGEVGDRRLRFSHDGWVEVMAVTPVDISRAAV
jgi:hypothetical protein